MDRNGHRASQSQIFIGGTLVIVGILLILMNVDLIPTVSLWNFWPVILIALGAGKIAFGVEPTERRGGFWLLVIGCWLEVSILHLFNLDFRDTWPMLLIAWGIGLIWFRGQPGSNQTLAKEH
jgi:hypothetical protein